MTVFTAAEIAEFESIVGGVVEESGELIIREARRREPRYEVALAAALALIGDAERQLRALSKTKTKDLYQKNLRDVDLIVRASGKLREYPLTRGLSNGTFNKDLHRVALKLLSDNPELGLGPRLTNLMQLLRRNLRSTARAAASLDLIAAQTTLIRKAITDGVLTGATNRQIINSLKASFANDAPQEFFGLARANPYSASGVIQSLADAPYLKIQSKTGVRKVHLNTHLRTIVRTMGSEIQNKARVNRMLERGIELGQVSPNPAKHGDFCDLYVGRVFALTPAAQRRTGFPLITRTPNGGPPFHVNCLHTLLPFLGNPNDPRWSQTSGDVATQGGVPTSALDKDWSDVSRWYKRRGGRDFARRINPASNPAVSE